MSSVGAHSSIRPVTLLLLAALVGVLLSPAFLRPSPAQADLNPCHLGAVTKKVCDGAGDLAGRVVDGVEWIADGVGEIAGKTWKATKPFLAAAAALGLAVGVPILCSKAAKALAAGGAAVAAGAGSGGTASAPAAAAGLAGATAVCTLLRKGSKLALKVVRKSGGKLARLAKLAAGATGLAALFLGTEHAAAWILQNALKLDAPSAPHLGSSWVARIRRDMNGLAGVLLVLAALVGLMFAAFTGRANTVGQILTGTIGAALVIGIVGAFLFSALQLSDAVSNGAVNSQWGQQALGNWTDLGDAYADAGPTKTEDGGPGTQESEQPDQTEPGAGTPADDGKGPWILRMLIAVLTVIAGALVWVELQVRDALLQLLLVFSGLLLAGYAFERLRHLARGFAMTLLGVVVAKPILVITLLLGGSEMQNAASTGAILPLLTGAGLMLLAGVLGYRVVTWMGFQGDLVQRSGGMLRGWSGGGLRSRGRGGGSGSGDNGGGGGSDGDGPGGPGDTGGAAKRLQRDAAARASSSAGAPTPVVSPLRASPFGAPAPGHGGRAAASTISPRDHGATPEAASTAVPRAGETSASLPSENVASPEPSSSNVGIGSASDAPSLDERMRGAGVGSPFDPSAFLPAKQGGQHASTDPAAAAPPVSGADGLPASVPASASRGLGSTGGLHGAPSPSGSQLRPAYGIPGTASVSDSDSPTPDDPAAALGAEAARVELLLRSSYPRPAGGVA